MWISKNGNFYYEKTKLMIRQNIRGRVDSYIISDGTDRGFLFYYRED